jgi:rhodanese-related sulfurtransferase
MINKIIFQTIIFSCLLIVLAPGLVLAFPENNQEKLRMLSNRHMIARDLSLSVTVAQTLQQFKQGEKNLFIDVRPEKAFQKYSIPESISLPLYAVKTKGFIKFKKAILVGQGFQYRQMEKECRRLRQKGFKISILEGGINRWYQLGGALQGDIPALKKANRIDSGAFFSEKDYSDIIVFTPYSDKPGSDQSLVPYLITLPQQNIVRTILSEIKKNKSSSPVILIAGKDEKIDLKIESILTNAGFPNLFFLNGGLEAYHQFLNNQVMINNTARNTGTTRKGCRSCQKH